MNDMQIGMIIAVICGCLYVIVTYGRHLRRQQPISVLRLKPDQALAGLVVAFIVITSVLVAYGMYGASGAWVALGVWTVGLLFTGVLYRLMKFVQRQCELLD